MIDAEAAVLGAVLADSSAYWRVADLVTTEDFANGGHRRVWALIAEMVREGAAVDCITVAEREPGLERLVFDLAGGSASARNARAYAEVVAKRATERRVIAAGQRIAQLRGDETLSEAQRILASALPRGTTDVRHVRDVLAESSKALVARYESQDELTGLPTSIPWLDEITSGWQRSDLIVLAARPSVGKTALGLQSALHAAQAGKPVLFFSAEMKGRQLVDRALAHLSHVSLKAIRSPRLIEAEGWTGITRATETLQSLPLWIDDSPAMTHEHIAARARQVDSERRLSLIVVDYLTHLRMPKADRRDIAVGEVTRAIKALAKSLDVPVILVSQLNRDAANARPTLASLRDSGDIEQDADVVVFLHRPDEQQRDDLELIVSKQRNGECGHRWLRFDGSRMTFHESEGPAHVEQPARRSGFRGRGFGNARDRAAGDAA